jgi:hypothetical protein
MKGPGPRGPSRSLGVCAPFDPLIQTDRLTEVSGGRAAYAATGAAERYDCWIEIENCWIEIEKSFRQCTSDTVTFDPITSSVRFTARSSAINSAARRTLGLRSTTSDPHNRAHVLHLRQDRRNTAYVSRASIVTARLPARSQCRVLARHWSTRSVMPQG